MDDRMDFAHVKAGRNASSVLQAFFVLFVVGVLAMFAFKMLDHTDGVIITEDENNEACWTSSKDIINKNNDVKAVKCKESAQKQSTTKNPEANGIKVKRAVNKK